jgi:hypothetical protein
VTCGECSLHDWLWYSLHTNKPASQQKCLGVISQKHGCNTYRYSNNTKAQIVKDAIKGQGSCGMLYKADTTDVIRAYIISNGTDATLLPQFSCGDLVDIQLKLKQANGINSDVNAP